MIFTCYMTSSQEETFLRFSLFALPTQRGKTFNIIKMIKEKIKHEQKSMHIIIAMNTLLNKNQFSLRVLPEIMDTATIYSISSKNNADERINHKKDAESFIGSIMIDSKEHSVVLMCSNKRRWDDISTIVEVNQRQTTPTYIYFDEMHSYIECDNFYKMFYSLFEFDMVKHVYGASATPQKIFDENMMKRINLVEVENLQDERYIGYKNMHFINHEMSEIFDMQQVVFDKYHNERMRKDDLHIISYISFILQEHDNVLSDDSFVFIPAGVTKRSHDIVRDIVLEACRSAVVVIVNGEKKVINYYDNDVLIVKNLNLLTELGPSIYEHVINEKLRKRPIVVTGMLCLEKGQSIMCRALGRFTSAIISHTHLSDDDVYQVFGRNTGFDLQGSATVIYCPYISMEKFKFMEQCIMDCCGKKTVDVDELMKPMRKLTSGTKNKKQKETLNNRQVPYFIVLDECEYEEFRKIRKKDDLKRKFILKYIDKQLTLLCEVVMNGVIFSTTEPKEEKSVKKHILDAKTACENNKNFSIDVKKDDKMKSGFHIFMYKEKNELCIVWQTSKVEVFNGFEESKGEVFNGFEYVGGII